MRTIFLPKPSIRLSSPSDQFSVRGSRTLDLHNSPRQATARCFTDGEAPDHPGQSLLTAFSCSLAPKGAPRCPPPFSPPPAGPGFSLESEVWEGKDPSAAKPLE